MGQLQRIPFCTALICFGIFTSALSFDSSLLMERSSGCSNPADFPCDQGLPSNFCCASSTICLALAGNTTALCCPSGSSCAEIQIISCDIGLQNATVHPENSLMTTDLSGTLPLCGTGCCPFGYTCSSSTTCTEETNQDFAPGQTALVSSPVHLSTTISSTQATLSTAQTSTTASISTTPTSPTNTIKSIHSATQSASTSISSQSSTTLSIPAAAAATTSLFPIPISKCPTFPINAILAGFFPGLTTGLLLSLSLIYFLHRRRLSKHVVSAPLSTSTSAALRTDFLLSKSNRNKISPDTPSNPSNQQGETSKFKRMTKLVRKSLHLNGSDGGTSSTKSFGGGPYMNMNPIISIHRAAPIPPLLIQSTTNRRPHTPPAQRAQSGVSINVFASSDLTPTLNPSPATPKPLNVSKSAYPPQTQGSGGRQRQKERESHQTTFDDLLYAYREGEGAAEMNQKPDLATLRKGEAFVQQPLGHMGHVRGGSKGSNGSRGMNGHRRDGSGGSRGGGNMV